MRENTGKAEILKQDHLVQIVINKILGLALEKSSLQEMLDHFIGRVTSLPLVGLETIGAALLVVDEPEVLVLQAQRNLPEDLQIKCRNVPFGKCLCGQAAASGQIIFANSIDERHETRFPGIKPHGHYCVPIKTVNNKVVGVFTVYMKAGCRRDERMEKILQAVANVAAVIIERKKAEEALVKAHADLEKKVEERTAGLTAANKKMKREIQERKAVEKALRQSESNLEKQKVALEETNTALSVLLKKMELERQEIEEQVLLNVKEVIVPYLGKLNKGKTEEQRKALTEMLEFNLHDILAPFMRTAAIRNLKFTHMEMKVANLVWQGKTTKEIAEIMHLSPETINIHRKKIRKKCGITNKKVKLCSVLSAYPVSNGYKR